MGSGELAPGLVRVHRAALADHADPTVAILDTPFGFQENADELTDKLVSFFETSLQMVPEVASLRWAGDAGAAARARGTIEASSVLFSGPGSPSYALRVWRASQLDDTLRKRCTTGTVTFASAAACTLGRWAIPVYEIYKVIRRDINEERAIESVSALRATTIVPLAETLALEAADISLEHGLAMADAIIFATAASQKADIVTADADFEGLPRVTVIR